mgnify:CR=1 FL=1
MVSLARVGKLLRRIRAACVIPLSAQSVSQIRTMAPPAAMTVPARFAAPLGQGSFAIGTVALYTLPAVPQYRSELSKAARDPSDFTPAWEQMVEFSGTPFTQQVRVRCSAAAFGWAGLTR